MNADHKIYSLWLWCHTVPYKFYGVYCSMYHTVFGWEKIIRQMTHANATYLLKGFLITHSWPSRQSTSYFKAIFKLDFVCKAKNRTEIQSRHKRLESCQDWPQSRFRPSSSWDQECGNTLSHNLRSLCNNLRYTCCMPTRAYSSMIRITSIILCWVSNSAETWEGGSCAHLLQEVEIHSPAQMWPILMGILGTLLQFMHLTKNRIRQCAHRVARRWTQGSGSSLVRNMSIFTVDKALQPLLVSPLHGANISNGDVYCHNLDLLK
jgi:hypothetical protein